MTQLNKITAAVALALAAGLPALQAEAAIQFVNGQGLNPVETGMVTGYTTTAGNYVFDGIDQTKDGSGCTPGAFNLTPGSACVLSLAPTFLYGQTVISGFKIEGGGTFQARATGGVLANEYTIVLKVPVYTYTTSAGTSVTLNALYNPNAGSSFFEIWAGDRDSNAHSGAGFNNGDSKILSGKATAISGLALTSNTTDALKLLDNRVASDVASSGPREFTVATGQPVASITNSGSTDITFDVTGGDTAYFPTLPASIVAGFDINPFGPNLKAPFVGVAPTHDFSAIGGPTITYNDSFGDDTVVNPVISVPGSPTATLAPPGTYYVNNFNCGSTQPCDFMVEGAGDGTFDVASIPEPGALALLGLGLAGIGAFSRRRRSA